MAQNLLDSEQLGVAHQCPKVLILPSGIRFQCVLESLHLDVVSAAKHITDGSFLIIDRHIMTERRLHRGQPDLMQIRLDRIDLDAFTLEASRIVASPDCNGIGQRFPVSQVMEKQRRFMGKDFLRAAFRSDVLSSGPAVEIGSRSSPSFYANVMCEISIKVKSKMPAVSSKHFRISYLAVHRILNRISSAFYCNEGDSPADWTKIMLS